MKNNLNHEYFKYSYGNFGNKILSFLLAIGCNNSFFVKSLVAPCLIIAFCIDFILYKISDFKYGFLIVIGIFLIFWTATNISYLFVKKGVFIYNDYEVLIKSGYFVTEFINTKFRFNVSEIENINIYKDKIRFRIWENQMQIPKGKEYILIELKNKRKYAFMLENNQKFVNTINEIRNKYINE